MNYIEIEKELIPYSFTIDLGAREYEMEINYNERFDFFTVDLYLDEEALVVGEKLMLDRPLFTDLTDVSVPPVTIVPRDRSGEEMRITYENLEETVFLVVGGADDDGLV